MHLFSVATVVVRRAGKNVAGVVGKPVNPKCGLRVECVGNSRHDDSYCSYNKEGTRKT